jgi:hypothetical protein
MRTVGLELLLAIPVRLSAQSGYLSYSSYLGGDGEDIVHAVATDSAVNAYLAETTSSNFPATARRMPESYCVNLMHMVYNCGVDK